MSNDPPSLPGEGNAEKSRKCIVIPCIWRTFLSSATKPRVKNWYDASLSMWRLIVFLPSVLCFISSQAQFSSRNPSLHGNGIFSEYWWFNYCDQGTSEVLSYQKTHQSQWPLQEYSVQTCTCKRMYTVLFPPHLSAPFPWTQMKALFFPPSALPVTRIYPGRTAALPTPVILQCLLHGLQQNYAPNSPFGRILTLQREVFEIRGRCTTL